jgi:hypothetical protein
VTTKGFASPIISGSSYVVANMMATENLHNHFNFRTREINRDARKLTRISIVIKIKFSFWTQTTNKMQCQMFFNKLM